MTQKKSIQTGIWAAAAGIALTVFAPLASAQPRSDDSHRPGAHAQQPQRGGPQMHQPAPRGPNHPAVKPGNGKNYGHANASHRGAGPDRNLHRGGKLPPSYRTKHYVVDDWRGHGLQRPARGQQWVQVGSDYLLVAAVTGLIAQVVLH